MFRVRRVAAAIAVALVIVVGVTALPPAPGALAASATSPQAASIAGGQWLQFKRDLAHTGLNSTERGAITADELGRKMAEVEARGSDVS